MSTLPTDSTERKNIPLMSGCLNYFPAALAGLARWSKLGNDKHNPGEPLHHARGKSMDHGDCIIRHLMDIQELLAPFMRQPALIVRLTDEGRKALLDEADALFWRAGALSQELHERFAGAPLAPAARLPSQGLPLFPNAPLGDVIGRGIAGFQTAQSPAERAKDMEDERVNAMKQRVKKTSENI